MMIEETIVSSGEHGSTVEPPPLWTLRGPGEVSCIETCPHFNF